MDGKLPYEIPTEMREFAERSVEQARKAFDSFIGAAHKAVDNAHGSAESARANTQEATMKAFAFAENNIAAAFDFAQKVVKSKDLTEVMQHQSDFLKSQVATFQNQIKELGTVAQDVASKAAESVSKATKGR
jgi:phasin